MPSPSDVTALLRRFQSGDSSAADDLAPLIHDELHRLAHRALARLPAERTLQTTALLNEAWMRIARPPGEDLSVEEPSDTDYASREHFLAIAAKTMRSIVVDRARSRMAERHGGTHRRVNLDEVVDVLEARSTDLLGVDEALQELSRVRPELSRVVELRFFAGMNHPAIARVEGMSLRTVERHWRTARAWLQARLEDSPSDGGPTSPHPPGPYP